MYFSFTFFTPFVRYSFFFFLEMLENMKLEWAKTNSEYQGMTHIVNLDTIGKVRRKER